jgi:hypothetical protein
MSLPIDADTQEHIELFERFLDAVQASRRVSFTQTETSLRLKLYDVPDEDHYDRQDRIRLIQRTLAVLKKGYGQLVTTKGREYFEFWVESNVTGALPSHNWASEDGGLLNPHEFERLEAKNFGWKPLDLPSLKVPVD